MHSKTYYAVRGVSRLIVKVGLALLAIWGMQLMIVLTWGAFGG